MSADNNPTRVLPITWLSHCPKVSFLGSVVQDWRLRSSSSSLQSISSSADANDDCALASGTRVLVAEFEEALFFAEIDSCGAKAFLMSLS